MDRNLVTLDTTVPIWDRFFTVAPLVLVGSREPDGTYNLAPKHMVTPLGWGNYFGFVCTPRHGRYGNVVREKAFTVTYPRPTQVVLTSLAATPRCDDTDIKYTLAALSVFPSRVVDGVFVEDGYLFLECELERVIDGFGENSLVTGRVVAAYAAEEAVRTSEREDAEVLRSTPLLTYLAPGRYTEVREGLTFPFPLGFQR